MGKPKNTFPGCTEQTKVIKTMSALSGDTRTRHHGRKKEEEVRWWKREKVCQSESLGVSASAWFFDVM